MSKSDKKPRTHPRVKQLELFATGRVGGNAQAGGTSRSIRRAELLSRLAQQRTLTINMMDKILSYESLIKAYRRVKSNQGSAGIDGVSLATYDQSISEHIKALHEQLSAGEYVPQGVKVVEIPKPNGGTRQLGIPTIADRIVQQSILQVLQPVYEPYFSENSYGFRPGRSAHQAIEQAASYVSQGKVWVVDIDLKNFFDQIDHDRLMSRLSKAISDKRLLRLIHCYLKADLMRDGLSSQRISGTPQGGPLSPLLSNIVLDELDRELEVRGLSFVRYADDCNVFVKSRRAAERIMNSLINYIESKLKLKVNRDKSGVRLCDQVKFLGHTIEQNGKIRIADASVVRFKDKIRELTKRNRAKPFARIIEEVNRLIQGWAVYFGKCNTWHNVLRYLDGWIRKRLRCYALKQHQKRYATFRFLCSLGVERRYAWHAVMNRRWWSMANYRPVMAAMGIQWFAEQGLRSLVVVQSG